MQKTASHLDPIPPNNPTLHALNHLNIFPLNLSKNLLNFFHRNSLINIKIFNLMRFCFISQLD